MVENRTASAYYLMIITKQYYQSQAKSTALVPQPVDSESFCLRLRVDIADMLKRGREGWTMHH